MSDEECDERSWRARELNLGQYPHKGYHGPWWTPTEEALIGTMPDAEVAERIGRTAEAVRIRRQKLGIPNPAARPGAYHTPRWTAEEDELVRTCPPRTAARRTGRTLYAVNNRRRLLGLPRSVPRRPERAGWGRLGFGMDEKVVRFVGETDRKHLFRGRFFLQLAGSPVLLHSTGRLVPGCRG